jgi:UTP--glucose-1-phosphate uridylyltransferase
MIKKAVIPVAGLGTRFLPATKAQPKEMLPVVDKPVIQYIVEEAVASGIEEIIFVTGKHKRAIEDHFDSNLELEMALKKKGKEKLLKLVKSITNMVDVIFIRQKEPLGLGHAILTARPAIGNEPFAVLLGDEIMVSETPALKQLIETFSKYNCSILGVQDVPKKDVSKYGIISGKKIEDKVFKVDSVVEKPPIDKAPSNIAIVGRYIFTPRIFDFLKKVSPDESGEIQLTDGIEKLSMSEAIYARLIDAKRYDTGSKIGFLKATVDFALERDDLREDFYNYLFEKLQLSKKIANNSIKENSKR